VKFFSKVYTVYLSQKACWSCRKKPAGLVAKSLLVLSQKACWSCHKKPAGLAEYIQLDQLTLFS